MGSAASKRNNDGFRVIRCINCGHYLFKIRADKALQRVLCKLCKKEIEVEIQGENVLMKVHQGK